jgi:hypothetical protein
MVCPYDALANKIVLHQKLDASPGYILSELDVQTIVEALRYTSGWKAAIDGASSIQDNDTPFHCLDLTSLYNMRQWFKEAVERRGGTITGASVGMKGKLGMADIHVEVDNCIFHIEITPQTGPQ